jgi:uncharacterized protein (DUF2062 family)
MKLLNRWGRQARIFLKKIVREKASPEYIAKGWALGMFIGCFIPFGCQLIISIPLSYKMKCSKIGATLGTFITNPVSIIFLYPLQCVIGSTLCGGILSPQAIEEGVQKLSNASVFSAEGLKVISSMGGDLIVSFFLGGLVYALVLTPITYIFIKKAVIAHRKKVEEKKRGKSIQKTSH